MLWQLERFGISNKTLSRVSFKTLFQTVFILGVNSIPFVPLRFETNIQFSFGHLSQKVKKIKTFLKQLNIG